MTQYLMLNHGAGTSAHWDGFFRMLIAKHHLVGGSAVKPLAALKNGESLPVSSATVSGYIVIQATDLEEAQALARQSPVHVAGGLVEIFELYKT